uniref:Uncharacterized protein n=1 Tax=Rhizophora mucronata TaxID=61149 RepID=A0A2P2PUH1_RHIMU
MYLASAPPVPFEQHIFCSLVVEAFDGADIGADEGDLRGGVSEGTLRLR